MTKDGFPRQLARTRRFTLGVPRAFTPFAGPQGSGALFLRSDDGEDALTHLFEAVLEDEGRTLRTHKLVDARTLGEDGELPPEERARRERAREQAGGIVGYATDRAASMAAFALAGRLYTVSRATGRVAHHPTAGPAFDPRPSPDGGRVAYHAADGLHVVDLVDGPDAPGRTRTLVVEAGVAWGRAEFVAAEEMGRTRGFWWSADGRRLAVSRVDEQDVPLWHVADPANPWSPPQEHRYPAAGTTNADVSLWIVDLDEPEKRVEVAWDRQHWEYLASVSEGEGPLTLQVQTRDQRQLAVLTVDPDTGATTTVRQIEDDAWVELVPGAPQWLGERLLTVEDRADLGAGGTRTICLDGVARSPAGLQVRELLRVIPDAHDPAFRGTAWFIASPDDDPTRTDVYRVLLDPEDDACWSTTADDPGTPAGLRRAVLTGAGTGPWIESVTTLDEPAPRITLHAGPDVVHELHVRAAEPEIRARPRLLTLGPQGLRGALLLPRDDDGRSPLPVLLDPYGGPHAQRVLRSEAAFLSAQWLADQGFAVLIVDGRGSPGRGPRFERAIHRDLATSVLDDQIEALHAAAAQEPRLDLARVAIRGWSFGGYLAALAVLRRPEVFRAAIAGAPVTDWRLYDTHYTERYLGHPDEDSSAYAVSSLIDADGNLHNAAPWNPVDPPRLLLIHGLADDNVVAAHALRLSSALLAEGRAHRFLPLSGVTHMTPQEVVAEQLLRQQVSFLHEALHEARQR